MNEPEKLFPPPPVVRDQLARNIRERRLLRALLRLSIRVAEDRRQRETSASPAKANGQGGRP